MNNVRKISNIIHTIKNEKVLFSDKINVMYGIGIVGKRFFEFFIENNISIEYIIDNSSDKADTYYKNTKIISLETFKKNKIQDEIVNIIITTSNALHQEIIKTLKNIENINILILEDYVEEKFCRQPVFKGDHTLFSYDKIKTVPHRTKFIPELCVNKEVLSIGCVSMIEINPLNEIIASGNHLFYNISKKAKYSLGVDVNKEGIRQMQEIGLNVVYNDIFNCDKEIINRKYDIIVLSHVIEHIPDIYNFTKFIVNNFNYEKLIIAVPNSHTNYISEGYEKNSNDHYYAFTPITTLNFLRSLNLFVDEFYFDSNDNSLNKGIITICSKK